MFVAMNGFVLVARTKLIAGGFVRIRSICTKTFTNDLSQGTGPRNLVLLVPSGDDLRLEIPIGLIGLLVIQGRGPVIPQVLIEGISTLRAGTSRVDIVRAVKSANSHTQELGVPTQNARSVLP